MRQNKACWYRERMTAKDTEGFIVTKKLRRYIAFEPVVSFCSCTGSEECYYDATKCGVDGIKLQSKKGRKHVFWNGESSTSTLRKIKLAVKRITISLTD